MTDNPGMTPDRAPATGEPGDHERSPGSHFSCSMTAVLLGCVHDYGGDQAVAELLEKAHVHRPASELLDIANWVSYDEGIGLLRAGAWVTHHPQFARMVGAEAVRRLHGSPVATLLRSLGSPENVYRQIATTATKYSTVATLEAGDCGPGFAEIVATPVEGFPRNIHHCAWTSGLLSQPTVLFGLPPAEVSHERCAAYGAPACEYRITWTATDEIASGESSEQIEQLREQLGAMRERLHSMFQTAADLISAGDVDDVLARIAERAAIEVRAPRHLLAVRMTPGGELHCHHHGFDEELVGEYAERMLDSHPAELPASWLVVPVRSNRNDYGRLLATYPEDVQFFPQERELLEVYARYAASALDSASALLEARRRYGQSSALLQLARALSVAGTTAEIAQRLADSVPLVVDCDKIGVYIWDPGRHELVRHAAGNSNYAARPDDDLVHWSPTSGDALERLVANPSPDPIFIDRRTGDPALGKLFTGLGHAATILVPLATPTQLLGVLVVAVTDGPERLSPSADLLDRLSGVAAQGTTALQNGRLVDLITHQALHDQLTGLANRLQFTTELRAAVHRARERSEQVALFYIDLDQFKPVNDELGHDAGDALLMAVGQRLTQSTRADDVVARLGGDEFAVLLVAPTQSDMDKVKSRILASFREPFSIGGREVSLDVSVGRSVYPADAGDADSLLRRADAVMFADKRARRARLAAAGPARSSV
ncbi:MAG: sensor domain-containing diguanylate cyclase [Solirubrobacteraceae bacterium]